MPAQVSREHATPVHGGRREASLVRSPDVSCARLAHRRPRRGGECVDLVRFGHRLGPRRPGPARRSQRAAADAAGRHRQAQAIQVLGLPAGAVRRERGEQRLGQGVGFAGDDHAGQPEPLLRASRATQAHLRLEPVVAGGDLRGRRSGSHNPPARGVRHAARSVDAEPRPPAHAGSVQRAVRLRGRAVVQCARTARAVARRERAVLR